MSVQWLEGIVSLSLWCFPSSPSPSLFILHSYSSSFCLSLSLLPHSDKAESHNRSCLKLIQPIPSALCLRFYKIKRNLQMLLFNCVINSSHHMLFLHHFYSVVYHDWDGHCLMQINFPVITCCLFLRCWYASLPQSSHDTTQRNIMFICNWRSSRQVFWKD